MNTVRYSLLRWVPNPMRGEFVNIAVVAWDEQNNDAYSALHGDRTRAKALGEMSDDIEYFIEQILESMRTLPAAQRTARAQKLFHDSKNVLQFTYPMPTAYADPEKLQADLSPLLIDVPA